ncbi:Trifunctional UDP-glucose 4,6-dehydratase/UDP-4-keto-6-deoxy-D-glucose 3,5-epimerase/UDP-4-keto-L-rhamnose-reductase RHM1 [Ananas comosus]|uniref:Trifunctional UDP-glucose 4,6-dehydratase/UDP-4-keto-6-deoxy-D-glucose 3,5-epimerase/UDP-4-keto-L-rhamnose-reductase RHM1 n=1 Tax=Ananas comosus TaxID=4615 RepID=A0A199W4F8_ANACO|nr:Trifunctional UDP-glucose 4,6-dehydratase/UDP-4-keto-6-deoxy-D-glucose 3,5-epimerase/UDP-4-keto-L-rhamnose-reductase RHM1 [Ananas comosus]
MAAYKPKNILITGAAGFIASHVANRLASNYPEYNIVVLDKLDYCSNIKNLLPSHSLPNFKFVKGDIACADLINFILTTEAIDTVMHFAAQTHVDNSFGNSFEFTKSNVYGTHVLLEACRTSAGQIRRFIHVSTDEVYGETDEDAVVGNHEASQLLPTNPYSASKAGAEMLVMAYGRSYGLPVVTTRGNNVYGPNQFPEKLIPKFVLLAMRGQPLPIHGDGSNVRSYLYCEDVAEAFDVVLHKGAVGHVYNIGTKKERRVIDVAKDICKLFTLDPDKVIQFVTNRPFNDQRYYLDDQKLKKLGWSERTTWEEGLRKTIEWYRSNPDWWGDVSGALLPHPRMLTTSRPFNGSGEIKDLVYQFTSNYTSTAIRNSTNYSENSPLKFLIYGRTGWIGGLLGSGLGFKEEDKPNFTGSFYSKTKAMNWSLGTKLRVEDLLQEYNNVCTLRVRMPISSDLNNPRNFITKISRYDKVVNIPNSMTVLDELLPISVEMARRNCRGIWNFTNPGVISHNEILELYRSFIDPNLTWVNFTLEEQAKVIVAPRSNNEMDASKLKNEFPEVLSIKDSLIKYVFEPNRKITAAVFLHVIT